MPVTAEISVTSAGRTTSTPDRDSADAIRSVCAVNRFEAAARCAQRTGSSSQPVFACSTSLCVFRAGPAADISSASSAAAARFPRPLGAVGELSTICDLKKVSGSARFGLYPSPALKRASMGALQCHRYCSTSEYALKTAGGFQPVDGGLLYGLLTASERQALERNLISFRVKSPVSFVWHSQTTRTFQPNSRSVSQCSTSRSILRWSFVLQKSFRVSGILAF